MEIRPDPKNARRHSDRNKKLIRQSLEQVGAGRSILVDADGIVRAGNGVYQEAQALNIPVQVVPSDGKSLIAVQRTDLRGKDAIRAAALDNLTADSSSYDYDADILAQIAQDDEVVAAIAKEDAKLREILKGEAKGEPQDAGELIDKAAQLQEKWQVKRGDIWQIGKHRLMCGDSTSKEDVARLMGGEKAQLCFTSPPYWVGKDYEYQTTLAEVKAFVWMIAGNLSEAVTRDGGRIVINCSTASARAINPKADVETLFTLAWWQEAFREKDWLMRHCRVWLKHGDMGAPRVAANSDVVDQHWEVIPEFLPTFYNPDGLRRGQEKIGMAWAQLGVWADIHGERSANGTHIAAFPIELPRRYIELYSKADEVVLDPFLGSGTTLAACEMTGRSGRGMELSEAYCAVCLERLSALGLEAKRV